MSDSKDLNSIIKIQTKVRINNCLKSLDNFIDLKLKEHATNKPFDDFKKIILRKDIIDTASSLVQSLDKYKKGLSLNPRILISIYMFVFYSFDFLGPENDRHPSDDYILTISNLIIQELDSKDIPKLWNLLRDYKISFNNWASMDKNRTIERLIVSYYHRSEHIDKIISNDLSLNIDNKKNNISADNQQKADMINELDRQRDDIIKSIKLIDKSFNIEYLKKNYKHIVETINNSWEQMKVSISNNMKKAYFDMISNDISNGNLISTFNLLKDIGERMSAICPPKQLASFSEKFSDDNLRNVLATPEFSSDIIKFIGFLIDFIIILDAPVNDENNKKWKNDVIKIIKENDNFHINFPKILIQVEEHIDNIISLIMELNK
jgi:hypothetical protein